MEESQEADKIYHCDRSCSRSVVLAYDGSEHSERALNFYFDNVMRKDDHIFIFHAFELPAMPVAYPYGMSFYDNLSGFVEKADEDAKCLLENVWSEVKERIKNMDNQPHIQLFKENGRAGEVICEFCKDAHASLLVLGSRGLGTIRRTFLGSVSDYCVHHAHIPVVIVPPPPSD